MDEKKVTEEAIDEVKETAETAEENVEEAVETAEAETEEAEEAVEEETEEAEEAAEEETEEAEETAEEETEEAEETAEEETEEAEETAEEETEEAEEAAEEETEEAEESAEAETEEAEESAEAETEEPPIVKKKLDKTNVIVIVVAAVVVAACLLFVAFKAEWIKAPDWLIPKSKGAQTLENYDTIEVLNSEVNVTDDTVQQYLNNILQSQTETKQIKEGVVQDGDQLNIDYVGKLAETGEAFEGGTASGQSLTIGSGAMIDGFESGLIGAPIGSTTTINVTFPENYGNKELAGKPATFDVTINYKEESEVPKLTDEFVQNYSENYLEKPLNTVAELKQYVKDYLYHYYLHSAMLSELQKKQTVTAYDEEKEEMLMQYSKDALDYYAAMYGTTADQYAAMYGMSSADEYAAEEAHQYLNAIMLIDQVLKDKKINWTEEDLNKSIALYMARNGYSERYSIDEFKEASGETWMYLYENLEFKLDLAMTALEENVKFVDKKTEEETSADEIEKIQENLDEQEAEDLAGAGDKTK